MRRFTPPPPPPAKLVSLLWLAMLAGPVQAQQLVIPATTGSGACTQGVSESGVFPVGNILGIPTQNSLTFQTAQTTFTNSFTVYAGVQEGGIGTPQQITDLGSSQPLSVQTVNFSSLKKNTRYTVVVYGGTAPYARPIRRFCFKTRGEFTTAEQNLTADGSTDLTKFGRTGCYAVARTRQDIADCMCNGTRGGTLILAGQTTRSQAQRQHWGCPDLDN